MSVTVGTDEADKRSQLYQANRFLRRRLGVGRPSTGDEGLGAFLKRNSFRMARKLGMTPGIATNREPYIARLRIDGSSPTGVSPVPGGSVQTLF